MIRVAAFDIGKVLLDFDYRIFVGKMAPHSRLDIHALEQFLAQSPLLAQYESGQLDCSAFFQAIQAQTGYEGTQAEFAAHFEDIFTPIQGTIALHAELAARGLPTWTFSNTNAMAIAHISRAYDFWPHFTGHILSHEVGALKPDPKIYEALETATGCAGPQIAYLDDLPENIAAAKTRGWQAIQFKDVEQVRAFFSW